jgi:hypothetical protein
MTTIRKGQAPAELSRAEFGRRFRERFYDPAYAPERDAIGQLEQIAWEAQQEGRKAPVTQPGGRGFADPGYEVSVQWLDTRQRLKAAQERWQDAKSPSRVGMIDAGSAARLDRYIGYYEPYYNSHDALDRDHDVQEETRNVARAVINAVKELRVGRLSAPDRSLDAPRPK